MLKHGVLVAEHVVLTSHLLPLDNLPGWRSADTGQPLVIYQQ